VQGPERNSDGDDPGQRPGFDVRHWLLLSVLTVLFACVTTWSPPVPQNYHRTAAVPDATERAGAEECEVCHEDVAGHALGPDYHADCESCHGPGLLHSESEETTDIRFPANRDCQSCHQTGKARQAGWSVSEHERSGVLCADCHQLHSREPLFLRDPDPMTDTLLSHASDSTKLCVTCHAEVESRLNLPSHHPVGEGMLDCVDCHKPHDGRRTGLGTRTTQCTSCHEDHAGPWIFEHAPVTEDCGYCHQPHGTSAFNLLESNEPGLCIACHTVATSGATHDPSAWVTRCSDCHGAIHGSFADPHLRR
jgi:DmsE family decaheme c-type cytochrome